MCDDIEWLNGLSNPIPDSYHPNRTGHASGYVPLIGAALAGSPLALTQETMQSAASSAPVLARQQGAYAARDAAITPQEFVLPDLETPAARAAAARAGVDLDDPASIERADRAAEARQDSGPWRLFPGSASVYPSSGYMARHDP